MNCMKCGREIEEGQVFCIDCLKDMANYPVRPGTAVHLPKRPAYSPMRRTMPKRKVRSQEEIIRRLRLRNRWLSLALTVAILLAILLAFPAVQFFLSVEHYDLGQNYTVIQDLLPSEEPEETIPRQTVPRPRS